MVVREGSPFYRCFSSKAQSQLPHLSYCDVLLLLPDRMATALGAHAIRSANQEKA